MAKKVLLLLTENTECQLVNVKGVTELEHYYFAIIIIKTGPGKNYQWMLNLGTIFDEGKYIVMSWKHHLIDCLLFSRENNNYRLNKLYNTLNGWSQVTSPRRNRWAFCAYRYNTLRRTQHYFSSILARNV